VADELSIQIEKRFPKGDGITVGLELDARPRPAVTVLFGPSGSGKTTILRCVAGLEQPESGFIRFGSEVWFDAERGICLTPQRRRIGFLFQDYALFPHLTVRQNLGYGLARLPRSRRQERLTEMITLFQLGGLENRHPRHLSGGQLQRVALARAVAPAPRLLLLDEPLSALDDPTRSGLRSQLRQLLTRVGIPALLVTHDRTEAIALGDWLAVVVEGRIQQVGSVQEVFARPANHLVARSVGIETVLPGRILATNNGLATVQLNAATLLAVDPGDLEGSEVYACIRAEEVMLSRTAPGRESARNHLRGTVASITPEGPLVRVVLECGVPLVALITKPACDELNIQVSDTLTAVIKAISVHLIPRV
jgi:molybdate transport system ATP-binding protein